MVSTTTTRTAAAGKEGKGRGRPTGRSTRSNMGRAPCCDKANVKKGPWSPEEDAKLKSYIEQHGTGGNWIALPQKIGLKRCGKSCRLRWLNYLRPNIKHGGFSDEEDNIICSLYISIGSRWSIIAAQLPGRTDNDIKNYWNTKLKKKLLGKPRKDQQRGRRTTNVVGGARPEAVTRPQSGGGHMTPINVDQNQYFWHVDDDHWPVGNLHEKSALDKWSIVDSSNFLTQPLGYCSNAYGNPMSGCGGGIIASSSPPSSSTVTNTFSGGEVIPTATTAAATAERTKLFTTELDEILYSNPLTKMEEMNHGFYGDGTTTFVDGGCSSVDASSSESLSGSWNDISPLAYPMSLFPSYLGLLEQHYTIYDQEVQLATHTQ